MREFHYRWEFDLESSPEQLWPLVADTNRFNRDTGLPSVSMVVDGTQVSRNARRRLRVTTFGIPVECEEQLFEWTRPSRFGVVRKYSRGPLAELRVIDELSARLKDKREGAGEVDQLGTKFVYEIWATPKNIIGLIAIPIQLGLLSARVFARTFREYDLAARGHTVPNVSGNVEFVVGGRARLLALSEKLAAAGTDEELVSLLVEHLENADELSLTRMRPYELARQWRQPRRRVLEACLCATRAGILD